MPKHQKSSLLRNFNLYLDEAIAFGKGVHLYTKNNKKYLDTTGGLTGTNILGWGNKSVERSIIRQLRKIPSIDYKYFLDDNRELLAKLLLSLSQNKLDKVFFVGGSGGEACEAAMKMSYQYNLAIGRSKKKWFISRRQSYHGSTSDSMALGDRPNLKIYKNFSPKFRAKINEHNVYRQKRKDETEQEYTLRSVKELEEKILEIGPENICGFIAETMMGGLVGDVPPTKNYWKNIRKICNKYKILLILDEVWCGTGTTGKSFCVDWDSITPDIIFLGKTLAAGYSPVSALVTKSQIGEAIKKKFGAIQFSTTHQGHSLGVAASLGVQNIIQNKFFLKEVQSKGDYFRKIIGNELKNNKFFKNIRGRGMRNSVEYNCDNNHLFGCALTEYAKNHHNLLLSAKWHRVCFSQAINISWKDLDEVIEKFLITFKENSSNWNKIKLKKFKLRNYY